MSSMHSKVFALIDCNNFYVSCERIFNPALNNKPIIVLSNNDGCVISRSDEAKMLGIKMGQPYFQIEALCRRHHVCVFSSNFSLYGDISNRVMRTINALCPDMEIYSIDEAFVRLDAIAVDPIGYAKEIKDTVLQHVGIPVSVGVAPTKTLAKLATRIAKNQTMTAVCDLREEKIREIVLNNVPVNELWGVGRAWGEKLNQLKIYTASQLCCYHQSVLKKKFSIVMTRLVMELKGISCLSIAEVKDRANITFSRSFGKKTNHLSDLLEAVSCYVAQACEKARLQKLKARVLCVYVQTSPFGQAGSYYDAHEQRVLLLPTNDTLVLTEIAHELMRKIVKPNYLYQKVGVVLQDLISEKVVQKDLFFNQNDNGNQKLMSLLDSVNQRWGSRTLFLGSEGVEHSWQVRQLKRSPRYTTSWDELPVAFIF